MTTPVKNDTTLREATRILAALGVERVEIAVLDRETDKMRRTEYDVGDVLGVVPYLKHRNAKGCEIYISPVGEHSLVLVDDLDPPAIAKMKADGFEPALAVRTSWDWYQAWVKLDAKHVPDYLMLEAQRYFVHAYDGDRGCIGLNHLGRFLGRNNKPEHLIDGARPWVSTFMWTGKVAPGGAALIEELASRCQAPEAGNIRVVALAPAAFKSRKVEWDPSPSLPAPDDANACDIFEKTVPAIAPTCWDAKKGAIDESLVDWRICVQMLGSLRYSRRAVEEAVLEHSLRADDRGGKWHAEYAHITVENAWVSHIVLAARKHARSTTTVGSV